MWLRLAWLGDAIEAQGGVALLEQPCAGEAAVAICRREIAPCGVFGDDKSFGVEAFPSGDTAQKAQSLGVGGFVFVGRI